MRVVNPKSFVDKLSVDCRIETLYVDRPIVQVIPLEVIFFGPMISLISWRDSSIVFVSFKPCRTSIGQFFFG